MSYGVVDGAQTLMTRGALLGQAYEQGITLLSRRPINERGASEAVGRQSKGILWAIQALAQEIGP